jgi:hypothetical protein
MEKGGMIQERTLTPPPERRTETFLLRQLFQSNMMTALAMENEFQLNQTGQTLEPARLSQEELRQPSHPIPAAPETSA